MTRFGDVTKLVTPVTKVRTGRPPLGQVAMTAAERQRRRRAALKDVPNDTPEKTIGLAGKSYPRPA
jgi:hypothetical protein